jgi:hypothetical protein
VGNDLWAYDQAAQGWEEITFKVLQLGCDLSEGVQELNTPPPRAGHSMVSLYTAAITCGGYGFRQISSPNGLTSDGTKTFLADSAGRIDCWWLTPGTIVRQI